ncbi:MAG: 3-dehydroquinate synthase [Candidatus Omnitrophica bacterium]|nr:3-dehydroquinate synthase [Candidatus Omnitrophota bacterium]MCM8770425.1 3-dehydroquinate synthase [Candidatus Omnitrophota bacterium]
MEKIKVDLGCRNYNIIISSGAISQVGDLVKDLNLGTYAYIITHPYLRRKYGVRLENSFLKGGIRDFKFKLLPESEKTKSINTAVAVIRDIVRLAKFKRIFLVAFGGGVIGDLTGFIASIYKRGVPYIQIPTTLLSQVDAAIGGKTAVDLPEAKNLIGAFYQPRLVVSDISLLRTLNARQMRSGLAEVIKYGIIKDKILFKYLERNQKKIIERDEKALEFIINRASRIKAKIVEQDEREEKGVRTVLNFGHTFGHAIEAAAGYRRYTHGEAVALGMLCALDISARLKLLKKDKFMRIIQLIRSYGLPCEIKGVSLAKILSALYYDKKFQGKITRFVLLKDIGKTLIKENLPISLIKMALKKNYDT